MPIDIMYGTPTLVSSLAEYAERLCQDLELAYRQVRVQLGHKLCRQKDFYDERSMEGCMSVESWCGSICLWSLEANPRSFGPDLSE